METNKLLKEFKKFEESKIYDYKYKDSIKFLKENKEGLLLDFDKNDVWGGSNPEVERELKKMFGLKEDVSFYVYINRDSLRLDKMEKEIKTLKALNKKEVFCDSFDLSDNKKLITLIIIDKYSTKEIVGRLVKVDSESNLFLLAKGKSRSGLRLSGRERYFIK